MDYDSTGSSEVVLTQSTRLKKLQTYLTQTCSKETNTICWTIKFATKKLLFCQNCTILSESWDALLIPKCSYVCLYKPQRYFNMSNYNRICQLHTKILTFFSVHCRFILNAVCVISIVITNLLRSLKRCCSFICHWWMHFY